jgi:hypothetical protein
LGLGIKHRRRNHKKDEKKPLDNDGSLMAITTFKIRTKFMSLTLAVGVTLGNVALPGYETRPHDSHEMQRWCIVPARLKELAQSLTLASAIPVTCA